MNIRNAAIGVLNRLGMYNTLRDFCYKSRSDNPQRRKFLGQFVREGSLCFDVGSNIGEMADLFRSLGGRVIAFEPQMECAAFLRKKFQQDNQVTVVEKAISSQIGEGRMYSCEANQLSTLSSGWLAALEDSKRFGEIPAFKQTTVATTTMEEMIKQYGQPDFLKVDVEGGEYEVLKNLQSPVACICFEYAFPESRKTFELCLKHLDSLGHAQYNMAHDDKGFVFPEWSTSQELFKKLANEFKNNSCGNVFVRYGQ